MDVSIRGLEPGSNYVLQARSKGLNGITSGWSTSYKVLTMSDTTPPNPITSLSWSVSGSSFLGTWSKPTLDSDGKPLKDFNGYVVTLTANSISRTYVVNQERFDFSFAQNVAAFATAQPTLTISVRAKDMAGNLSSAITATATNSVPLDIANFTATGIVLAISLKWDTTIETDFKEYGIYMSTSGSGFIPGPSNLLARSNTPSFVFPTNNQVVHYFKINQIDLFDQASTNFVSASATPLISTQLDVTPPTAPTNVVVSTAIGKPGESVIQANWTAVTSTNLGGYVVRYSTDQTNWQYINVPSDRTSALIAGLQPNKAYYVGVAAISFVSAYSAFINAVTYPITTAADTTAPSTPSIPTVSFGTSLIQIAHDMTKSGGGALESDVRYLEVHGSTTSGFTSSSSTLFGTIDVPGLGIPVSANFSYSPTDSITNMYWRVIAVDYSGNKSVQSSQVTGMPGLIQGANIADATITNAKINDLSAAKLTAGTAFINNLSVRSALTLDSATGYIQSTNFNASSKTGWRLDQSGLAINDGSIAAKSLFLQNGNNIVRPPFADFEFNADYYHDASNIPNATQLTATSGLSLAVVYTGQKVGKQALRIYNTSIANTVKHTLHFATDGQTATGVNIDVNPGDYILSIWAKKNNTVDQNINLGIYTDSSVALESANLLVNNTAMTRYSAILTVPSGVSKVKTYLNITPVTTGYDLVIDALQLEPKLTAETSPSAWKPPSTTIIDGGSIITGSIRSSAASATVAGQPAWSINTQGNIQLGDALVRGRLTVGAINETKNLISKIYTSFEEVSSTYFDASNIPNPSTMNVTNSNFRLDLQTTGTPPQGLNALRIYGTFSAGALVDLYFGPASPLNIDSLVAGQNYIFSAWVKSNDTTKSPNPRFGLYGASSGFRFATATYIPTAIWTRISGVITGVSEKTTAGVRIALGATETTLDISIDGLQLELAPSGVTTPSAWELGGQNASSVQSANYIAGSRGWVINSDGTVEFNTANIRGQLNVVGAAGEIEILTDSTDLPYLVFSNPSKASYGYINFPLRSGGYYGLGINSSARTTTLTGTGASPTVRDRLFFDSGKIQIGSAVDGGSALLGGQIQITDTLILLQAYNMAPKANGPLVALDSTTVQFKNDINQINPVQYNSTTKWMGVAGMDWTNLTMMNGWVGASGFSVPQIKMTTNGMAVLRGTMTGGNAADGVQVFALPSTAWYPAGGVGALVKPTSNSGSNPRLFLNSAGQIFIYGCGGSTEVGLDGLSWYVGHP